jgi:hypothetical protein
MPFKSEKQRKWMHANEPEIAKKWEKKKKNEAERDYKAEYKKYGSSTKAKKYRAELNKYNRQKGTYGNGDGKDASHKGGKIVGFENQSVNRGRAEKSRLRKEAIFEDMNDAQLANGIKHWASKHKGTGIGYSHVLGQLAVHMKEMGWNKSYKEVVKVAKELAKKKTVESVNEALQQKFKKGQVVKTDDGYKGKIVKVKQEFGRMGPGNIYWVGKVKDPYSEDQLSEAIMLSENPAAAAGAAMASIQIQNAQGKKIKGTSALQSSDPKVQKKAKSIFQRLKDKFEKRKSKKGFEKQKKAAAAGVDDYIRKLDKESVNEISFSHVSTQKLVKSYKQMADERLSGAAALTFRLIAKELKKRKVKLPESVNEDWWSEMSSYDQAQYIKDHPNSAKAKSSKKARKEKEADRKKLAKRGYDIDATTGKAVKQSKKEDPKKKEKHKKAISKGIFPGSPEYSKFMKESTKSWNKSLEKIARDRQLKSISKKDRETLMRIAQMMKKANESVNEKVVKVSKDIPGNPAKMKGEEKIKKLTYSGSNGKGSYEIKGKKLNVNGIRPRDKGFFVNHFTKNTGFRKANLYYDGVHWQGKNKF